jgi:hypothetical protein
MKTENKLAGKRQVGIYSAVISVLRWQPRFSLLVHAPDAASRSKFIKLNPLAVKH